MPQILLNAPFEPFTPTAHNFKNLVGQHFGRVLVLSIYRRDGEKVYWLIRCDCGTIKTISGGNLKSGHTLSCGCYNRERTSEHFTKHGEGSAYNPVPEYRAFNTAKGRCNNPRDHAYDRYGGRGIEFRFESYEQFLAELGRKPTAKHSLDRINVNGHYEPGNVRWATDKVQGQNKRNNRLLTYNGVTKTESEWAIEIGFKKAGGVTTRLKLGWCVPCAVTLQAGIKASEACPHRPKPDRWSTRWANMGKSLH